MQISTAIPSTNSATYTGKTLGVYEDVNLGGPAVWQVLISSTGTVTLQGSLDGSNWFTLPLPTGATGTNITASGLATTAKAPYMRAVISANAGSISVLLGA